MHSPPKSQTWSTDRELFDAIELFLEDEHVPIDSASSRSSSASASGSMTPVKNPRRPRHVETRLLRDQIAQLEALHRVLTQRRAGSNATDSQQVRLSEEISKWKALAEREFQARELAVSTNIALRKQVRCLAELMDRVRKQINILRKQLVHEPASSTCVEIVRDFAGPPRVSMLDEPGVYEKLAERAERLFERTDSLLEDPRLRLSASVAHMRDVQRFDQSLFLDSVDTRLVPFDMAQTEAAVWDWMVNKRPEDFPLSSILDKTIEPNFMRASILIELNLASDRVVCLGKYVIRRFPGPDRVVFVISALVDDVEHRGVTAPLNGMMLRHSQWIILHRPSCRGQDARVPVTCTEIVIRALTETERKPPHLSSLQQHLERMLGQYQDILHDYVDNTLLEASLNPPVHVC